MSAAALEKRRAYRREWQRKNRAHCTLYQREWARKNRAKSRASSRRYRRKHPDYAAIDSARNRRDHPEAHMLRAARARAKRRDLPFNLKPEDIHIPKFCPIFGTRLQVSTNGRSQDSSPSLDRIVPGLGYVQGNVIVVSMRANRLKADATLSELQQLSKFYSKYDEKKTSL